MGGQSSFYRPGQGSRAIVLGGNLSPRNWGLMVGHPLSKPQIQSSNAGSLLAWTFYVCGGSQWRLLGLLSRAPRCCGTGTGLSVALPGEETIGRRLFPMFHRRLKTIAKILGKPISLSLSLTPFLYLERLKDNVICV